MLSPCTLVTQSQEGWRVQTLYLQGTPGSESDLEPQGSVKGIKNQICSNSSTKNRSRNSNSCNCINWRKWSLAILAAQQSSALARLKNEQTHWEMHTDWGAHVALWKADRRWWWPATKVSTRMVHSSRSVWTGRPNCLVSLRPHAQWC